jgi:translocation and assembly module TamB
LKSLDLEWNPLGLLYSRISVRKLLLEDLQLQDNRPEDKNPPDLSWPTISGVPLRLGGSVHIFRIHGVTYQRLEKSRLRVDDLSAAIVWRRGTLTVKDLRASLPAGSIQGTLSAGFERPAVKASLLLIPSRPVSKVGLISIEAQMQNENGTAVMGGNLHITGTAGKSRRVDVRTGVEMERHSVKLTGIRISLITPKGEITGEGEVIFPAGVPFVRANMKLSELELSPFLHTGTNISGGVTFEGTMENYHGSFDLTNRAKDLKAFHVSGLAIGDSKRLELSSLEASWLEGTLKGRAGVGWQKNVAVDASLQARGLDPSVISKDWKGTINADVRASAVFQEKGPISAGLSARLRDSRLRGQALTGEMTAHIEGEDFLIKRLFLRGKGFDIAAHGELAKQLFFSADVTDLSGLVPGAGGEVHTKGWVKRQNRILSGDVSGMAGRLSLEGLKARSADFSAQLGEGEEHPLHLKVAFKGLEMKTVELNSADVEIRGTQGQHVITAEISSGKAHLNARLSGGYADGAWKGKIAALSGRDAVGPWSLRGPADISLSSEKVIVSSLLLDGVSSERLELSTELSIHPLQGILRSEWRNVNLARVNPWLKGVQLSGAGSGKISSRWLRGGIQNMSAEAAASGTFTLDGQTIGLKTFSAKLARDEQRLLASFTVNLDRGGGMTGHFSSAIQAGSFFPEKGEIDAELHDLDISFFQRWIPPEMGIGGALQGSLKGRLLPGRRLEASGDAALTNGIISRRGKKGEVSASIQTARMKFAWRNTILTGTLSLALKEYGHASGSFMLPLPARLPVGIDRSGQMHISLQGDFQEKGLLTALFPGLIQETHGEIEYALGVTGTWGHPALRGRMKLSKAGAYLPTGGVHIKDVIVAARFKKDRVIIDSFQASSGPGKVEGTAEVELRDWTMESYKGTLKGKDFQVIYLPELRVQASPDLTFEGTGKKLSVRGEIKIPDMLARESNTKAPIQPSKDVIVVDRQAPAEREIPLALDIQVKVTLGDNALVKAEGVDAQLEGSVELDIKGMHNVTGKGEIHVVKGKYSAYGVSLDIQRGRVIFTGRQVSQPNLDVLALKTVEEVKAGVVVSGTLQHPAVKLYSDPGMSDTDILAYIVLGHPLGSSPEQASLVARAAGFLLSASDSVVFQNQLKRRLGLDTLDIETQPTTTGVPSTLGTIGPSASTSGGVARSLVTVGKYLTPDLYISYGRSLFGDANLFRVRYALSKHWELETQSGTESGADLFYKIDLK